MSCNQRRILKLIMLPVRNHPQGRTLISHYQAIRHEKEGRCVILDGQCLWMHHQPRELVRYNGETTKAVWRGMQSGYAGPIVMEMIQGV